MLETLRGLADRRPAIHVPVPGANSRPVVKPVVAPRPAPVTSSPSVPTPATGVQVPVSTPTTTPASKPPLAPVAGTATYSPLAATEEAMAVAIAEAWAARMEAALHAARPVLPTGPGVGLTHQKQSNHCVVVLV